MGHIDEIGLVVTHVDDEGYLWFDGVGGWTPTVLVGQRIRILAKDGPGRRRRSARRPPTCSTRTSATSRQARPDVDRHRRGRRRRRPRARPAGDLAVIEQPASSSPAGAWSAAPSTTGPGRSSPPRRPASTPTARAACRFVGVASVAEETSFAGAHTSSFALAPQAAIAIDVTHASDYPSVTKHEDRRHPDRRRARLISAAPASTRRSPRCSSRPPRPRASRTSSSAAGGSTWTDADAVSCPARGVPTCLVSVPEPLHALAERDRRAGRPRGHGRADRRDCPTV